MSRVFEALTAAVDEKKNPAKPGVAGTAVGGDSNIRFYPVLRTEAALTEAPSSLDNPTTNEEISRTNASETHSDRNEFPVHKHEQDSENFYFKRAPVAALLAAVASVMVYLTVPGDYAIHTRANSANTTNNSRQQNVRAIRISDVPELQNADTSPAEPELPNTTALDPQVPADLDSIARHGQSGTLNKTWSVQVSATTSKEIANKLAQQLKSEGYAVYVVQAEVKGQSYHRVRVGPFSVREEAERVRESLTRHYGDAYLPTD